MKPKRFPTRILALWLTLAIGLPSPALALRQVGLEENAAKPELMQRLQDPQSVAGLEEIPQPSEEEISRWLDTVEPEHRLYGWLKTLPPEEWEFVRGTVSRAWEKFGAHMRWTAERVVEGRAGIHIMLKPDGAVTDVEKEVQATLNRLIGQFDSMSGIGEEGSVPVPGARYTVLSDPVDGTANYIRPRTDPLAQRYLSTLSILYTDSLGRMHPVLTIVVAPEYPYGEQGSLWLAAGLGVDGVRLNGQPVTEPADRALRKIAASDAVLGVEGKGSYDAATAPFNEAYRRALAAAGVETVTRDPDNLATYLLPGSIQDPALPGLHLIGSADFWDTLPGIHLIRALDGGEVYRMDIRPPVPLRLTPDLLTRKAPPLLYAVSAQAAAGLLAHYKPPFAEPDTSSFSQPGMLKEQGRQAWPITNTLAVGAIAGGIAGSAAVVAAADNPDPKLAGTALLVSMVLGSSAATAIRAWWFRPRVSRGVERLLRADQRNQPPGLRNRFFTLREAIRPRVRLTNPQDRSARRILLPVLLDWVTYWVLKYDVGFLLSGTQLVLFQTEKTVSGESTAWHTPLAAGGGNLITIASSSRHRQFFKELRAKEDQPRQDIETLLRVRNSMVSILQSRRALLESSPDPDEALSRQLDEQEQKLQELDLKLQERRRVKRGLEIRREQILQQRHYRQWAETALATEAFHTVENWFHNALSFPVNSFQETLQGALSNRPDSGRLSPARLSTVQSEAGDHLSNRITGAWSSEYLFLRAEDLDLQDKDPATNNHALASLISATALRNVDQWIQDEHAPLTFRDRLLFRMMQLNSLSNVTQEYGAEPGVQEWVYRRVMKMLNAPDVLTEFWLEDRAYVMPLARFARSIQDFQRPAELYDRLRGRIRQLQKKQPGASAVLDGWIISLDQEQQELQSTAGLEEPPQFAEQMVETLGRSRIPITMEHLRQLVRPIWEENGWPLDDDQDMAHDVSERERAEDFLLWVNARQTGEFASSQHPRYQTWLASLEGEGEDLSDPGVHAALSAWFLYYTPFLNDGNHRVGWALIRILLQRAGANLQFLESERFHQYNLALLDWNSPRAMIDFLRQNKGVPLPRSAAGLEEGSLAENWDGPTSAWWGNRLSRQLSTHGQAWDHFGSEENFHSLTYGKEAELLEKWVGSKGVYFIRNGPLFFVDHGLEQQTHWLGDLAEKLGQNLIWVENLKGSSLGDPRFESHTHATMAALRRSPLEKSMVIDLGAGDGFPSLEALRFGGASFAVLVDNDPQALEKARRNLKLNGFQEGRDFQIVQVDLGKPTQVAQEIKNLRRPEETIALVSDIGSWPAIYGALTNEQTIALIPKIEKKTGKKVILFIGGGYREPHDPKMQGDPDHLPLDQAAVQRQGFTVDPWPEKFNVTLRGGEWWASALAWRAVRETAGLEEPKPLRTIRLETGPSYDESWLQEQERETFVPHLRWAIERHLADKPSPDRVVVWDVGAYTGQVAQQLPGDRVVAFERNAQTARDLLQTLQGARYQVVNQDFRAHVPQEQDRPTVIVASHLLYYFHRRERQDILNHMLTELPPGRPLLLVLNGATSEPGTRTHLRETLLGRSGRHRAPLDPEEVVAYLQTRGIESAQSRTVTLEIEGELEPMTEVARLFLPPEARDSERVRSYLREHSEVAPKRYRLRADQVVIVVTKQDPAHALRFPPRLKELLTHLSESEREQLFRVLLDEEIRNETARANQFLGIVRNSRAYVRLEPEDQEALLQEIVSASTGNFVDKEAVENLLRVEVGRMPVGGFHSVDTPTGEKEQPFWHRLTEALRLAPLMGSDARVFVENLAQEILVGGADFISDESFAEAQRHLAGLYGTAERPREISARDLWKAFPMLESFVQEAEIPRSLQSAQRFQMYDVGWLLEMSERHSDQHLPASLEAYRALLAGDPRASRLARYLPSLGDVSARWAPFQVEMLRRYAMQARHSMAIQAGVPEARMPDWIEDAGGQKGLKDFPPALQKTLEQAKSFTERVFQIAEFLGWNNRLLAQMAWVSPVMTKSWKHQGTAEPQPRTVPNFSAALRVHPIFLLTGRSVSQALHQGPPARRAALLLRARGMTQADAGQALGVATEAAQPVVQRALKSKRWDRRTLFDWAQILGVEPSLLEFGRPPPPKRRLGADGTMGFTRKIDEPTRAYANKLEPGLIRRIEQHAPPESREKWATQLKSDSRTGYPGLTRKILMAYPGTLQRMVDYGFPTGIAKNLTARRPLTAAQMDRLASHLVRAHADLEDLFQSAPEYDPEKTGGYGNRSQHVSNAWRMVARGLTAERILSIAGQVRLPAGVLKSKVLVSPDPEAEPVKRQKQTDALTKQFTSVHDLFGQPIFSPQAIQNYVWATQDPAKELENAVKQHGEISDYVNREWFLPIRPDRGTRVSGKVFARQMVSKPYRAGSWLNQIEARTTVLKEVIQTEPAGAELKRLAEAIEPAGLNAYSNGGAEPSSELLAQDLLNRIVAYRQLSSPAVLIQGDLGGQAKSIVEATVDLLRRREGEGQLPQNSLELERVIRESASAGLEEPDLRILARLNGMQRVLEYLAPESIRNEEDVRRLFGGIEGAVMEELLGVLDLEVEDVLFFLLGELPARGPALSAAEWANRIQWGTRLFALLQDQARLGQVPPDPREIVDEVGGDAPSIDEATKLQLIARARRVTGLSANAAGLEEAVPEGVIPVLVSRELVVRYPQLEILAGLEKSPVVLSTGDVNQDVANLISLKDARIFAFAGLEEEAAPLKSVAALAGMTLTRVISPEGKEWLTLVREILDAAGLEESARQRFLERLQAAETLPKAA